MDRINQPYDVNDTGYTQPVSARAGEPIESLRAQARQRPVSGVGSQQSGKIAGRSTAKTDSADISVSAWLRYLKGEEAVTSEKVAENTSQSYTGMRREQKTRTEYLLWLLADEDNSYLAERLGEKQNATKQSASESASSQNDWTRRRISSLLYFSGFQSQRVAFSHYQPAYAYASTAYQSEMQSTTSYTQPMVYEPSV